MAIEKTTEAKKVEESPVTKTEKEEVKSTEEVTEPKKKSGEKDNSEIFAIIAMVLGVINLCSWVIPCCGFIFGIAAIIFAILGMKSEKYKTFCIIVIVVSGLSLVGAIVNAIIGATMSLSDYSNEFNQF